MSKKKIGLIVVIVVLVIGAAAGGLWVLLGRGITKAGNGDKVYVEKVSSMMNQNNGVQNRYSGVVEPQESWEVKKDSEKVVKEILVKEGDAVEEGTPLFSYDTQDIQDKIATAKLELESINNEISDYYNQIETLKSERAEVSEDDKFQYTTQIQTIQTTIKQSQYNKESKNVEIERLEESLNHATITSEIAGTVKSISENGYDQYTGEELPFITVLATGDYRVKGTVNEQNIWALSPGTPVLLRSRMDENQTWSGSITEVDTTNQVINSGNGGYISSDGGMETATKYPFYVALDSVEGLILGQHLYIELDMGQQEVKEGVWLYESYIVMEDSGSYVWADNGKQRLEKRKVELGEYDEAMGMYQIKSGITEEDLIAFPMSALYEGVPTVTNAEEVDYNSPMYQEEAEGDMNGGEMLEDGMEGSMPEDGMEDGMETGSDAFSNGTEGGMPDGSTGDGSGIDNAADGGGESSQPDEAEPEVAE